MTTASAFSVALLGMDGAIIEVEAALNSGLPRTILVGLPDAALYEARDRCKAALIGSELGWPNQLLTINLTPASMPKAGSHYDLAICAAVLACSGIVPAISPETVLLGEVGLDGRIRPARGILPALAAAQAAGFSTAIVSSFQVDEAILIDGLTIWGVANLLELVEVLHGRPTIASQTVEQRHQVVAEPKILEFADVLGQPEGRWALEVAAAGGHHLFFHGPPGVGKTMLAERLPGLLPNLSDSEALEVSAVHSLAGADLSGGLIRRAPYADPHYNASLAAMVGGGTRVPRPGSISLAHRGVLFLDEAPEFNPKILDALRTPLESGWITIARSELTTRYPARFQLVLAANPCPCGLSDTPGADCRCAPMAIRRYRERISGPILDRIDIHCQLQPMRKSVLRRIVEQPETTSVVADRVLEARERARSRLKSFGLVTNAEVAGAVLRKQLPSPEGMEVIDSAWMTGRLTARGIDKILRLAWTLADLAGRPKVSNEDLSGAMQLRRGGWGRT